MTSIKIRKITDEDLARLGEIEALCFPAAEAASPTVLKDRWRAFSSSFLGAEDDNGLLIGFINGCCTDSPVIRDEMFLSTENHCPQGKNQSIFGLDVAPACWKQGIGAQLMEAFIGLARQAGRENMILTCKAHLIPYYEKFGYENNGQSASSHGGAVWYDMTLKL